MSATLLVSLFFFCCLFSRLVLPDGRVFAQILRNAATSMVRWDNGPSTIHIMGKNRAICDASKTGGYRLEGQPGVGLMYVGASRGSLHVAIFFNADIRLTRWFNGAFQRYNQPCCQPKCQWCLFSFCCFIPTAGIAGCFGLYVLQTNAQQHRSKNCTTRPSLLYDSDRGCICDL